MSISSELEAKIRQTIEENINANEETMFLCGGYGDFDIAVASIIKELKNEYPQILSIYVTPYINGHRVEDAKESRLYDDIIYPSLENTLPRFAISKRNEYMVKSSDIVIAYVKHDWGGAYKTLSYAKRLKKKIINLAESSK